MFFLLNQEKRGLDINFKTTFTKKCSPCGSLQNVTFTTQISGLGQESSYSNTVLSHSAVEPSPPLAPIPGRAVPGPYLQLKLLRVAFFFNVSKPFYDGKRVIIVPISLKLRAEALGFINIVFFDPSPLLHEA